MATSTFTPVDCGNFLDGEADVRDDVLTFAGTDVFVPGTILARDTGTNKLVLFVKGGVTTGNGIPKAVLTHTVERTGAGDMPVRVLVAGRVKRQRLVIDADGDADNIDSVVCDQLRDYGIIPIEVQQLAELDNT